MPSKPVFFPQNVPPQMCNKSSDVPKSKTNKPKISHRYDFLLKTAPLFSTLNIFNPFNLKNSDLNKIQLK